MTSSSWSCLARTLPSTTGSTISRCDGLAVSDRCTLLPSNSRSDDAPRWYLTSPEPSTSSGEAEPPLNSWKMTRCGLPITWREHVEAAAVGHAERRSRVRPSWPPRLMICSSAGIIASPPSRPKRLAPVILDVEEVLEALGLDQLRQDRALAFAGELDLLVRTLDALLDPGLLGGIGDVQELEADRAAIGAAQDRQHLAHGRVFEPEHVVDEDLAVVVGLGEAVGRRMQLLVVLLRLEAERIEVGVQMAAHAEGADHHDRAHRIAGGALDLALADRRGRRRLGGLGADLVAERLLRRRPVAVEGVDQVALRRLRPIAASSTTRRSRSWPRSPGRRRALRKSRASRARPTSGPFRISPAAPRYRRCSRRRGTRSAAAPG